MEISITQGFWAPLTQRHFLVRTRKGSEVRQYECCYQAGSWEFQMFAEGSLILESIRLPAPKGRQWLGRRAYVIFYDGREIGRIQKTALRKFILFDGRRHTLPTLLKPSLPVLGLTFPLRSMLYRRSVTSFCSPADSTTAMLCIAVTIIIWFTWNALPAD